MPKRTPKHTPKCKRKEAEAKKSKAIYQIPKANVEIKEGGLNLIFLCEITTEGYGVNGLLCAAYGYRYQTLE